MIQVNCFTCGKEFYTQPNRLEDGRGKYCSMACRSEQRKNPPIKCPTCGIDFNPSRQHKVYCSKKCCVAPHKAGDIMERFWRYVDKSRSEKGCWLWTGGLDQRGYGKFSATIDGVRKTFVSHKFYYEHLYGPVSLFVLHKCDNPPCINPDHLFLGTQLDNMRDKVKKSRQARGETNGNVKLKEEDILIIRERHKNGDKLRWIAEDFHVGITNISAITRRVSWKHIN